MSEIISLDDPAEARDRAVTALRDGLLVVVPTDSVYALVADAFSKPGTQRMFGAKRRGRKIPLPVLIRSQRQTTGLVEDIPEFAERLMAAYWPGPVTLVFRAAEGLSWDVGDAQGTVSLRMPTDDFLLGLIGEVGPLAVTTANRKGQDVPTTAEQAKELLSQSAALYVDGGERHGATSTIVDVTRDRAYVLSEGAIPAADIEAVASGETAWGARPDPAPARPDPPPARPDPARPDPPDPARPDPAGARGATAAGAASPDATPAAAEPADAAPTPPAEG